MKSAGFNLESPGLTDVDRLKMLVAAGNLAYLGSLVGGPNCTKEAASESETRYAVVIPADGEYIWARLARDDGYAARRADACEAAKTRTDAQEEALHTFTDLRDQENVHYCMHKSHRNGKSKFPQKNLQKINRSHSVIKGGIINYLLASEVKIRLLKTIKTVR